MREKPKTNSSSQSYVERHGVWELVDIYNGEKFYECSACDDDIAHFAHEKFKFCPFCGARMDERNEEEQYDGTDEDA